MTCDSLLLNSTCDVGENKRQVHVVLPFLKNDMQHWGPPHQGPHSRSLDLVVPISTVQIKRHSICRSRTPSICHSNPSSWRKGLANSHNIWVRRLRAGVCVRGSGVPAVLMGWYPPRPTELPYTTPPTSEAALLNRRWSVFMFRFRGQIEVAVSLSTQLS